VYAEINPWIEMPLLVKKVRRAILIDVE